MQGTQAHCWVNCTDFYQEKTRYYSLRVPGWMFRGDHPSVPAGWAFDVFIARRFRFSAATPASVRCATHGSWMAYDPVGGQAIGSLELAPVPIVEDTPEHAYAILVHAYSATCVQRGIMRARANQITFDRKWIIPDLQPNKAADLVPMEAGLDASPSPLFSMLYFPTNFSE